MSQTITVRNARYYPADLLFASPPDAAALADVQRRKSFLSSRAVRLDRTVGAFLALPTGTLLAVIDRRTVDPQGEEWAFIGKVLHQLKSCSAGLDAQARTALSGLHAVVFTTSPARSYADVKPGCFVYDVDEFRRSDGSFISAAYAASNIVHDANHIWQYEHGLDTAEPRPRRVAGSCRSTTRPHWVSTRPKSASSPA